MKLKAVSNYDGDKSTRFGDCILIYDLTSMIVYDCGHGKHAEYVESFLQKNATKNPHSEIFYAKQELSDAGFLMNYIEDAGEFGFRSTVSERELFQQRHLGLVKAIRTVYEKAI